MSESATPAIAHQPASNVTVRGSYVPFTGDFDCNGRTDVFWYAPGAAQDYIAYSTSDGFRSHAVTVNGVYRPLVGDFDDDGCGDVFWYAPGAAADWVWFGTHANAHFLVRAEQVWGAYAPIVQPRFDRDFIWWFHRPRPTNEVWTADHATHEFTHTTTDVHEVMSLVGEGPSWPIATAGMVVMYQPGDFHALFVGGDPTQWYPTRGAVPDGNLSPVVGNFDGEGLRNDILWYGRGADADYMWFDGSSYAFATGAFKFIRRQTNIAGTDYAPLVGDFDGNGRDDIFWYTPGSGGHIWFNVPHQLPSPPPPHPTAITTGGEQSCAIVTGIVKCWGANRFGELGNGTKTPSYLPVSVPLPGPATSVVAGFGYTCAIVGGGAWCWGLNNYGQLGDGSTTSSTLPVPVKGLSSGVTAIAPSDNYSGREHTCAIVTGDAWCWGHNGQGEIGDGTTKTRVVPVRVYGLALPVTSITAGDLSSCAVGNGVAKCWGSNHFGQLGTGLPESSFRPVPVLGLHDPVLSIGAGPAFACALKATHGVVCWGDNTYGELGTGNTFHSTTPTPVTGLSSGVDALAVGFQAACATHFGAVFCWGRSFHATAHHVLGLTAGVTTLSANVAKCAINAYGTAVCWGPNEKGELGNGVATGGFAFPGVDNNPTVVLHLT